jgi:preprotein translocase subunit SecY
MLVMIVGSTIFSIFWVNTAGMDPKSVAEQFKSAYLSIPGFRRDPRIIERVLERYILPLAVLGGAFVGFLAGFADLTGALGTGTGILLTAIIIMQFYESIVAQHLEDLHPEIRKFIGR